MKLAYKLALILSLAASVSVLLSSMVFLAIEYSLVKNSEIRTESAMKNGVAGIIREAQLADDPLILVDYLRLLGKEHKEIGRCRIWMNGKWRDVRGIGGNLKKNDAIILKVFPSAKTAGELASLKAQIWLSRSAIENKISAMRRSLFRRMEKTSGVFIFLGIIFALPIGRGLSRRIQTIENAVAKIGEGKSGIRLENLGRDEIGRLSKGVNKMAERLDEIERIKKDFVASVTHELRSPLGAIESHVSRILSGKTVGEEDRKSLSLILNNVNRLSHFVSNLLQMAKIERGKLDFTPKMAALPPIVEDGALFFASAAQKAGMKLDYKVDPQIPPLRLDPDLITHVLANFVSNALKFTRPGGTIFVSLERVGGWAECSVKDTGIGLEEKDVKRIFAPFERIRNPLKATGVGLGLAISKSIIEMHKGEIGVESKIGVGSRFYFRLPL